MLGCVLNIDRFDLFFSCKIMVIFFKFYQCMGHLTITVTTNFMHSSVQYFVISGDVVNKKDVEKALQGADCVFHLASYGM